MLFAQEMQAHGTETNPPLSKVNHQALKSSIQDFQRNSDEQHQEITNQYKNVHFFRNQNNLIH